MKIPVAAAAIALAVAAVACAHRTEPLTLASQTTQAVYEGNYAATTANFDDALKAQVTPASLSELSARMHALGAYRFLKQTSADPEKGRYDYDAAFDKGTMLVELRMDPDQKIAAYRVVPQPSSTPSTR